jgi:TonB family protein
MLLAGSVFGQSPNPQNDCAAAGISDVVVLKVVFLATGKIGEISVVKGLPDERTDQAISAARKITFKPSVRNGVPYDATRNVEYTFNKFFEEDSTELKTRAKITQMPNAKFKKKKQTDPSQVEVELLLNPNRGVEIIKIKGEPTAKIRDAVTKAALAIKFEPAVHNCGIEVPQRKTVVYSID